MKGKLVTRNKSGVAMEQRNAATVRRLHLELYSILLLGSIAITRGTMKRAGRDFCLE